MHRPALLTLTLCAAVATAELLHRRLLTAGATAAEAERAMAGDHLVPDAQISATRAIDVAAPASAIHPWLTQMGFGRAGWYSWDWIDNLGHPSARHLEADWMVREAGESVPAGPLAFVAAVVDAPRAFVLDLPGDRHAGPTSGPVGFSLAFEIDEFAPDHCRLVCRARFAIRTPGGRALARWTLSPGDGIMVHRQLRGIAERAEALARSTTVATTAPATAGSGV